MGWEHLVRTIENYLPEKEGYEWLFKEEQYRTKLFKDNWHYGVGISISDGENQIKPIVVSKCLANPEVMSVGSTVGIDKYAQVITDAEMACEFYYKDPALWTLKLKDG